MTVATLDFKDALQHLPPGTALRLSNIGWDEYEEILREFEERPGYRLTYDTGKLEIMSPQPDHEKPKDQIYSIVIFLALDTGVTIETLGSSTFKRRRNLKGAEPDTCFYVQNAARVIGKKRIDLNTDPPPDVVVEIDTTNDSWGKFPIYAELGVPELWRYDGRRATFYALRNGEYEPLAASLAFPVLTPEVLTRFLTQSQTEGQTAALRAFRDWLRQQVSQ
jgi:Uma2 family endonuclease